MGSPARGHGSNCKLLLSVTAQRFDSKGYIQCILEMLINLHDGSLVTAPVAVVGSCNQLALTAYPRPPEHTRKYSNDIAVLRPVVALHNQLMCSRNERDSIVVVEGFGDVLSEGVARTTGRDAPSAAVIGVRPEEITHWAFVRDLLDPVKSTNVVQGVYAGRKSSVKTKDFSVN